MGDYARASNLFGEAIDLLCDTDEPWWPGSALCAAGSLPLHQGDVAAAEALLEGLARFRAHRHANGVALALSALAGVALRRGDPGRTAALRRNRLALRCDAAGLRWALEDLSREAAALGDAETATRLLGAVETHRARLGIVPRQRTRDLTHTTATVARATLARRPSRRTWPKGDGGQRMKRARRPRPWSSERRHHGAWHRPRPRRHAPA